METFNPFGYPASLQLSKILGFAFEVYNKTELYKITVCLPDDRESVDSDTNIK